MADSASSDDGKMSPVPVAMTPVESTLKIAKTKNGDVVLVPQPSDDPEDPLNWPLRKKIMIFTCICLAGFANQMSPNSNMLTFMEQVPVYKTTTAGILNTVAASLTGWVAGPFLLIPFVAVIGRSAVVFWSLAGVFVCQIWGANMTGADDYISFTISRFFCGMFGGIPAIIGSGYIIDMFYLHQRGKAFAIFEVLIIFAVVGGGTLGGFIAQTQPWNYVFWWTLGPVGAAMVLVFLFVEETTYSRDPAVPNHPLPKNWLENRIATYLPGTRSQPKGKGAEFVKRAITPFKITFAPITLLTGTYIFVALGLPIMQASTLATYMQPPVEAGGYGFSSLQMAFFTITSWIGIIAAQAYGYFFNDKAPLWLARRRGGGTWHTEYRLANTILPSIILPIGLGLWGVGLQYHLHYMVLALAGFLIWFAALLALPVCYNYVVECFLDNPVETSVSLNAYRVTFGLISVFIATQWQSAVGVGWMWGMGSFFILFVDIIMMGLILKGHVVRQWTSKLSKTIAVTEDGVTINIKSDSDA